MYVDPGTCAHKRLTHIKMCEEIKNSSIVVPQALLTGLFINGVLGISVTLVLMIWCEAAVLSTMLDTLTPYSMGDIDAMVASQETLLYPFLEVFDQATNSPAGSAVMAAVIVTMGVSGTVGALASASRMVWSFSRDRGFPYWEIFVRVGAYLLDQGWYSD